jgi:serralysin
MKQSDLLELFEHPLGVPESFLNPNAAPAVPLPPPVLPDESIEAQSAQNGPGGPNSVVAETSGGLVINLLFDAAAMAAPLSFRQGIEQAAAILSGAISDKITVNLDSDYSGTGGGAAAGPDNGQFVSYSTVRADLVNNATTGDTTFSALPSGSTIQGQSSVAVWNAQLKVLGLLGANDTTTDDGSATFATDINPNLLVGVALHELTHAMGRVPYGPQPDIFDFFRFTSPGTRLFLNGATAPAAYFSLDGGTTKLADYGQTSDASDFLNSGVQGANDPFNEFYSGSTLQQLTAIDLKELDALGFHLTSNQPTVIEALGSTSLVQVGSNFYFDNISTGTGPEFKYGGTPVVAGEFGAWTFIGAEQTSSGYEVALHLPGSDQYTVWNTDNTGNVVSNATGGFVSGTSSALESLEPSFHQDLNGDGVIGIPPVPSTVIEAFGSTSLVQVSSNFYLDNISTGTGPEFKYAGTPVVAGEFGAWTFIGAEQTSSGYEVALHLPGSDQYTVWNTDSTGNVVSNATGGFVSGTSTALESLEPSFHQDLNGDGVIGQTTIAAGAITEIPSAFSGAITFAGSTGTLQLDSSSFTGTVAGLNGLDTLDLTNINPATVNSPTYSGNSSGGTLSVTDGTHTTNIALLGNYLASTFVASSDGHGGTSIVDPLMTLATQQTNLTQPQHA